MSKHQKLVPAIAIIGSSNAGKTSLLCALVNGLKQQGYSVAVAKHAPHGHDRGDEGTDSRRIADAGADRVAVVSPGATSKFEAIGERDEESIHALQQWAAGCDLLLLEGWKSSSAPKILLGDKVGLEIAQPVIATIQGGRHYDGGQITELMGTIEEHMAESRDQSTDILVRVDGAELRMKRFPAAALLAVITGYLETLEGVPPDWGAVEIRIKRN